jgi:hypothetical protein
VSRATFVALVAVTISLFGYGRGRPAMDSTASSRDPLAYAGGTAISAAATDQYVPIRPAFCKHLAVALSAVTEYPRWVTAGPTHGIGGHMARVLERAARVSYAFVVMNYAAVAGLISLVRRHPLWRS